MEHFGPRAVFSFLYILLSGDDKSGLDSYTIISDLGKLWKEEKKLRKRGSIYPTVRRGNNEEESKKKS